MRTHNIILVTILVVICIIAMPTTARKNQQDIIANRWEQIPNINAPDVQEIARWAVAEHAKQTNDRIQFKRVMSGMYQVVAGKNFQLVIDASNIDGKDRMYIAEVFDQPWSHTRKLNSFISATN
jgi:hypothetical protein